MRSYSVYFENRQDGGIHGEVDNANGYVLAFLPKQDFKPMYQLLQTKRPVYAFWNSESESGKLTSFGLTTDELAALSGGPSDL